MAPACLPARTDRPAGPPIYRRRRPERTVLYQVFQEHLESYLAQNRWEDPLGEGVPAYVEREFRDDLQCGILSYGFARALCADCGQDFFIAFSCKGRTVCPSCNARRMAQTAAHLVDHVIPPVAMRQWVLSLPKRLRGYLHRDPALSTRVLRIFLEEIERALQRAAPEAPAEARFGAIAFIHRFGASLNLHLHYHCCVTDGLFCAEEGAYASTRVHFAPRRLLKSSSARAGGCCACSSAATFCPPMSSRTCCSGRTPGASR